MVGSMAKQNRPGRPRLVAPRGYVTIERAAEILGVSYSTVYKYAVARGDRIEIMLDQGGTFLRENQLHLIRDQLRVEVPDQKRKAIQVRPALERYRKWARAAGKMPVSVWLGELADKAAAK